MTVQTAPREAFDLRTAVEAIRGVVGRLGTIDRAHREELLGQLTTIERLAATASARLARLIGDDGARRSGGYRDAASLLSRLSGSSIGKARTSLETVDRLEAVPVLVSAISDGTLSLDQARVIGPVAVAAPESAPALLDAAKRLGFLDLKKETQRAARRQRADSSVVERERRIFARRYCRAWTLDDGGIRLDALLPSLEGARVLAALNVATRKLLRGSTSSTTAEPNDQRRADALVQLVTSGGGRVSTHVLVRVDARALRAGDVEDDEVCEIDGVGPISVRQARSLLPDAFLTLLVRDGVDIKTVTSTKRCVPRRVRVALTERDQACVVPGCVAANGLEIDHWRLDFSRSGPTELENLCRLCSVHHRLKTRTGWRLVGGPGKWRWLPPRWANARSRT